MRGSPLFRALIAFLVILALGYPLLRLTGDVAQSAPETASGTSPDREITLRLSFTTVPKSVKVLHLGREIWSEAEPPAEIEKKLQLPFPKEGVDLQIQTELPEGAPLAAVRVRLTDPDGGENEKSLWGSGTIDEVLTFP